MTVLDRYDLMRDASEMEECHVCVREKSMSWTASVETPLLTVQDVHESQADHVGLWNPEDPMQGGVQAVRAYLEVVHASLARHSPWDLVPTNLEGPLREAFARASCRQELGVRGDLVKLHVGVQDRQNGLAVRSH